MSISAPQSSSNLDLNSSDDSSSNLHYDLQDDQDLSSISSSSDDNELITVRRRFGANASEEELLLFSEDDDDDPKLSLAKTKKIDHDNSNEHDDFFIHQPDLLIILIALLFRLLVALHSFSGESKPPKFGDFEAQRHWMEITFNLPLGDWYRNTGSNDLKYWGLDYPPLSAYWAYITGYLANKINPEWVELIVSRGFQSDDLKTFMRLTVIFSDLLVMISGAFALASRIPNFTKANLLVALMTPAFLLIDHGHFQYNNVMLGFNLWALAMFAAKHYSLSVVFLMLSISFKHMNIYSIPSFGAALLGIGLSQGSFRKCSLCYAKWGLSGILSLALCFAPFLKSKALLSTVLHRLFPLNRGLFEEKVSNLWCSLAILTKFHRNYANEHLFKFCFISVIVALSPIIFGLLIKGSKHRLGIQKFLFAISYGCLVMYLFSYHVHEKQILIPLLPIVFLSSQSPWFVYFFTIWSSFSLFPLMRKDNLQVAYFAIMLAWHCFFYLVNLHKVNISDISGFWKFLIIVSWDFIVLNHVAQLIWTPPVQWPDLFLVLNTLASSGAFGVSAVYLLYKFFY